MVTRLAVAILQLGAAGFWAWWGSYRWLAVMDGLPFSNLFPAALVGGVLLATGAVAMLFSRGSWARSLAAAGGAVLTLMGVVRLGLVFGASGTVGPLDAVLTTLPLVSFLLDLRRPGSPVAAPVAQR